MKPTENPTQAFKTKLEEKAQGVKKQQKQNYFKMLLKTMSTRLENIIFWS